MSLLQIVYIVCYISSVSSFGLSRLVQFNGIHNRERLTLLHESVAESNENKPRIQIKAIASGGISEKEIGIVLLAVENASIEYGLPFILSDDFYESCMIQSPISLDSVYGTLGRIIVLSLDGVASDWDDNDERLLPFQLSIGEQIDYFQFSEELEPENKILDHVLVIIRPNFQVRKKMFISEILTFFMKQSLEQNDLRSPFKINEEKDLHSEIDITLTVNVEIDGAMVNKLGSSEKYWDTSSILVFDNLIDENLRVKLLDVILKRNSKSEDTLWDDVINGPDPNVWVRGGIIDSLDKQEEDLSDAGSHSDCWGLDDDSVFDLCFNDHPALIEFEKKLSNMFPDFIVSRLPEAVFGESVSPLTANAPTFGDSFMYHIDADPNLAPPSAWTDTFGRYPNRYNGKPRFMSCLLYLNDDWDSDIYGAPTRFLDPPTGDVYDVFPKPGRCVLMDQDITHSVVAPNPAAGKRPRYSLVWKLVFHPTRAEQDMKKLFKLQVTAEPKLVGSAKKTS